MPSHPMGKVRVVVFESIDALKRFLEHASNSAC
jgi:hypothetical protein